MSSCGPSVEGGMPLRVALVRAALMRMVRRGHGRARMKQQVLLAFERASSDRRQAIVSHTLAKMAETVSRPVVDRVAIYRDQGWLTVLATAAPECYARPFADSLGFDDCLATPSVSTTEVWVELIAARKADACMAWARAATDSTTPEVAVISDHPDDLPLLRLASRVVLHAPLEVASSLMSDLPAEMRIEHIDPVGCDEHGGIWLWINDCPSGPHDAWEVVTILSKHRYALLYQGDCEWVRIRPGESLVGAALRMECPRPPAPRDRVAVAARRTIVRDLLGIFH